MLARPLLSWPPSQDTRPLDTQAWCVLRKTTCMHFATDSSTCALPTNNHRAFSRPHWPPGQWFICDPQFERPTSCLMPKHVSRNFRSRVPQTVVLILDCTHVGCSGSVRRSVAHLTVRGCGSTQCSTPFGQNDNVDSPFRCLRVRLALSTSSQTSDPGDRHELVGTHTPLRRCPLFQPLSFICHVPRLANSSRTSRLEKHFNGLPPALR